MIHAAAKMTAAIAVAAFSLSAAVAVAIFVATRDHGDLGKNSPDLVCDPLLQLFGIVAWVISFAFSALWLMTHWRLQAFLRDPTKWTTWGGGGGVKEARKERYDKDERKKPPMVSVLLPVKGVHERTLMHWRSQVMASHGGSMEFIFCMESEEDPAYAAALDFRRECGDSVVGKPFSKVIKIVSCGLSFYCSQKIHNLLKGITLADYVLFLDDDAQMSSRILSDLIYALETEPDVLIASGWPNDYLPPDATFTPTFASFMLLGYRVLSHLSMGTLYPTVLWGGCLLLRRSELLDPQIGIIEAWRQSGYSDDMIMIGRARKAQRKIVIPPSAFLPSKIERDYSLQRHINYIRRQMFVCGTYHDIYDRINNLFLLTVVSIVFVLFGCFNFQLLVLHSVFGILKTIGTSPEALLPGNLIQPQQCGQIQASPAALYLLVLIAAGLWMYSVTSCYRSVISVGEYIAGKGFAERSSSMGETVQFSVLLFFGLAAQCALQAIAAAVAFFSDSIVWSGVRYFKRKGHVSAVYRTAKDGTPYTVEIEKARQEAYASYAQGSGHAVEEAEGEGGRGQKKDVASSRNGEDHTSRVVAGCI